MNDMYKIIEELCGKRHMNITQMCKETGVPRGSITDLKMGRIESLSTKTLSKLAEYFQVPMDRFINAEAKEEPAVPGGLSEEDRRALEVVRGASPEELEIVERIRKASPDQQKAILTLLGREKG